MHVLIFISAVFCTLISTTTAIAISQPDYLSPRTPNPEQLTRRESNSSWGTYDKYDQYHYRPTCKPENIVYRKEWRTLSKEERKSYTDAVRCLQTKVPALHKGIIPGASSRFDDFQIVHINQTFTIHFNGPFVGWHRWFTWAYEQALKKECGYRGTQPYWDWSLDANNFQASPLFDGSPYSMSSNGEAIPHPDIDISINLPPLPIKNRTLKAGTGGGCVRFGPFANLTVNYGLVKVGLLPSLLNNPKNLAYNPHCLSRDLRPDLFKQSGSSEAIADLLQQPNISAFNQVLEYGPRPNIVSTHAIGHIGTGGDMSDTFSSPGDPLFFLHHAQIDRLWTIWQSQDPRNRQYAVSGTGTAQNYPPSEEFKISDRIDLGLLSPEGPRPLSEFMNTVRGPFCYRYR